MGEDALARDIAERRTGMPAYLVDDETWAAAVEEAKATYRPPESKGRLAEAVEKARHPDPVEFINAYNAGRASSADTGEEGLGSARPWAMYGYTAWNAVTP